jgi:hypothetical protein
MSTNSEEFERNMLEIKEGCDRMAQMVKSYYDALEFNQFPDAIIIKLVADYQAHLLGRSSGN